MNFLGHYVIATRFLTPSAPLPSYVVGNALPDLLPLAADRVRLRPALIEGLPIMSANEGALSAGVLAHLNTDTAFHKTRTFAEAQAAVSALLEQTSFERIRVRRFFLAHILAELALDAALLRSDPTIAGRFYTAFSAADYTQVTRWTETTVGRPLPTLPAVLERFAESRYLLHYQEDEGVATGLSRLCARARQDTFEGQNYAQLVKVVRDSVRAIERQAEALLEETVAKFSPPARAGGDFFTAP